MEYNILDDVNYLIGDEEVNVDDIFERIAPHYPGLTKNELIAEAIKGNFSCRSIDNGPEMLKKTPKEPATLPPNKNPNFQTKAIRIPLPPDKKE